VKFKSGKITSDKNYWNDAVKGGQIMWRRN